MNKDFKSCIAPKSIALIGASNNKEKVGFQIFKNILDAGYKGTVYPINIKGGEILDHKVYKSVLDIKDRVDLCIIAIPEPLVSDVVSECIAKKACGIVVISAGFSEIGEEGARIEREIAEKCEKNGIFLLGPNCLGLINSDADLNATFAKGMPEKGSISLISQSGAIISSLIDMSRNMPIGFSKIFSLGNKASLSEKELLEFLYSDPETKVVVGYIESLKVSSELTEILRANAKKKPTILLFGGKSAFGAKAAKSHTGSVVTSYLALKTYLTQAGVILADDLLDLLLYARIFTAYQKIGGKNIAIISNAGGPAIAASDAISEQGLAMAELEQKTKDQLSTYFRKEANINNPVDILGDASDLDYQKALEVVLMDKNVDGILLLLTPQTSTKINETAEIVAKYKGGKPLVSSFVGGAILSNAKEIIEESGKPCFSFPEEAVASLSALNIFSNKKQCIELPKSSHALFLEKQKNDAFKKFNLPVLTYKSVSNDPELLEYAKEIGYPVVLKTDDPTGHKTDKNGVIVNIQNAVELKKSALKIGFPAIVGKMVKGDFELMLGIKKDESIGTTVLFGTGGIYSEIYADFNYAIAPLSDEMAKELILNTKIGKILGGVRGRSGYNIDQLAKTVINAVNFADNYSNIKEMDFNPIIVNKEGYFMVDVRIILSH